MIEGDSGGMEKRTPQPRQRGQSGRHTLASSAVQRVSDNGMARLAEVHANLVSSARADGHPDQRHATERFALEDMGYGRPCPARR